MTPIEVECIVRTLNRPRFALQVGPVYVAADTPQEVLLIGTNHSLWSEKEAQAHRKQNAWDFVVKFDVDTYVVSIARFKARKTSIWAISVRSEKPLAVGTHHFFSQHWQSHKTPVLRLVAITLANKIRGRAMAEIHEI